MACCYCDFKYNIGEFESIHHSRVVCPFSDNVDSEDDPYEAFISNDVFNFIGKVVIGFREADENEIDVYDRENPPPAAVQQTTDQPALKKHLNDFTRHTFSTGCYHLDPIVNKWSSEGCKVQ